MIAARFGAYFVRELVRGKLDLSAIVDVYEEERGQPTCDPVMSRRCLWTPTARACTPRGVFAQACEQRLDFMAVTALAQPDFRRSATSANATEVAGAGAGPAADAADEAVLGLEQRGDERRRGSRRSSRRAANAAVSDGPLGLWTAPWSER